MTDFHVSNCFVNLSLGACSPTNFNSKDIIGEIRVGIVLGKS